MYVCIIIIIIIIYTTNYSVPNLLTSGLTDVVIAAALVDETKEVVGAPKTRRMLADEFVGCVVDPLACAATGPPTLLDDSRVEVGAQPKVVRRPLVETAGEGVGGMVCTLVCGATGPFVEKFGASVHGWGKSCMEACTKVSSRAISAL